MLNSNTDRIVTAHKHFDVRQVVHYLDPSSTVIQGLVSLLRLQHILNINSKEKVRKCQNIKNKTDLFL